MDDRVFIKEQSSKAQAATTLIVYLAYAGYAWYALEPTSFARAVTKLASYCDKLQHRISVWRAKEAIQSLPVTDVTDDTGNNEH